MSLEDQYPALAAYSRWSVKYVLPLIGDFTTQGLVFQDAFGVLRAANGAKSVIMKLSIK